MHYVHFDRELISFPGHIPYWCEIRLIDKGLLNVVDRGAYFLGRLKGDLLIAWVAEILIARFSRYTSVRIAPMA